MVQVPNSFSEPCPFAAMIDTVVIKFITIIEKEILFNWEKLLSSKPDGRRFIRFMHNIKLDNNVSIKCTYYPYSFDRKPLLTIELSLPHIVYGNNFTMLFDLDKGISRANTLLSKIPIIPSLDIGEGKIIRLDACYNHHVGEDLPFYIKALRPLKYSHRKTMPYTDEGVQFYSKQISTKFYDKERECKDSRAKGILRQETTARNKALKRITGSKGLLLRELNLDMLISILENDLIKLKLYGRSIGTRDSTLETLCEKYGELGGTYYYGLLHSKTQLSKETIASATNSHPRTLDRRLQKIVEADVPLTLSETSHPLPPLVINNDWMNNELVSESTK